MMGLQALLADDGFVLGQVLAGTTAWIEGAGSVSSQLATARTAQAILSGAGSVASQVAVAHVKQAIIEGAGYALGRTAPLDVFGPLTSDDMVVYTALKGALGLSSALIARDLNTKPSITGDLEIN
jgi:hypothetical protein